MPKLLNAVPVLNLAALEQVADIVRVLFDLRFLADVEVQLGVVEVVFLVDAALL